MVNVNTVYTTVLYLLNKEQRGYLTPTEFDSIGAQVQEEIFNSYFPDGNQTNRQNQNNTQNDTEFFDIFENISYKLYPFQQETLFINAIGSDGFVGPDDIYLIGEIISTYIGNPTLESITDLVSKKDFTETTKSKLTTPTTQYPLCYLTNILETFQYRIALKIFPLPDAVTVNCIVAPEDPNWAFTTGTLGQYLYDFNNSTQFQLDVSEQTNLIIGILKYAGVIVRDPEIIQTATQEAAAVQQNEKS